MNFELSSTARVATDRPARYGKQVCNHFGNKVQAAWDPDTQSGQVTFNRDGVTGGECWLSCEEGVLVLDLHAHAGNLEKLEGVMGSHLARFGAKDSLVVSWVREGSVEGSSQGPYSVEEVAQLRAQKRASA